VFHLAALESAPGRVKRPGAFLFRAAPALVLLALAGPGLGFGLPRRAIDRDERLVVETAVGTMSGDWRPINLRYPTAFPYAIRCALAPYVAWTAATTRAPSAPYHFARLAVDPYPYFFTGRALALVCGIVTVLAVVALGSRLAAGGGGWIAGLVVAFAPVFVEHSRSAKVDVPLAMWTALALLASSRAVDSRRWRDALAASFCVGMALGSKWSAAPLLLALLPVAAALANAPAREARSAPTPERVSIAALLSRTGVLWAVAAAVLLATTPAILLEPKMFAAAFQRIAGIIETPFGEFTRPGYQVYPEVLAGKSFGLGFFAAALAGAVVVARARDRAWAGVALFGVTFAAIIVSSRSGYPHFALPLIPVLALLASRGTIAIARAVRCPPWCVFVVALLPTLPGAVRHSIAAATNADTRLLSLDYIERRVPTGLTILAVGGERGLPPLLEKQAPPFSGLAWLKAEERLGAERYRAARELAVAMREESGVPQYSVWRVEIDAFAGAIEKSRPAAVVVFNRESVTLPDEVAALYEPPVVFRPGWFREWRPILVLVRRNAAADPLPPESG